MNASEANDLFKPALQEYKELKIIINMAGISVEAEAVFLKSKK